MIDFQELIDNPHELTKTFVWVNTYQGFETIEDEALDHLMWFINRRVKIRTVGQQFRDVRVAMEVMRMTPYRDELIEILSNHIKLVKMDAML